LICIRKERTAGIYGEFMTGAFAALIVTPVASSHADVLHAFTIKKRCISDCWK